MIITALAVAQSKADIEKLAVSPKKVIDLPLDYAIVLPSTSVPQWVKDFESYDHFITPAVRETQRGLSLVRDSVQILLWTSCSKPHAQLDTSMRIADQKQLIGTWRSVSNRMIKFQDSVVWNSREVLRNNTFIDQQNGDDVFLQIRDKQYIRYVKAEGEKDFKREGDSRYALEGGRFLMLYPSARSAAVVSQVGIDKEGRLVIHKAIVEDSKLPDRYIVYQAVISQSVYERVTEQP